MYNVIKVNSMFRVKSNILISHIRFKNNQKYKNLCKKFITFVVSNLFFYVQFSPGMTSERHFNGGEKFELKKKFFFTV